MAKGKCCLCGKPSWTIRDKILRRGPTGTEKPVELCFSCDRYNTDLEVVLGLFPSNRGRMVRVFIYGQNQIPPTLYEAKHFYSPVCINDIKKQTLDWSGWTQASKRKGRTSLRIED